MTKINSDVMCANNVIISSTLHITSGECSAYALRQLLPKADIVAFNEAMCEGACCGVVGSVDFKQLRSLAYNVNMDEYLAKSARDLAYGL